MLNLDQTLSSELPLSRYLVLELAGLLDRIDDAATRDGRSVDSDARLSPLRDAIAALQSSAAPAGRVERILRMLSEPEFSAPSTHR